MQYIAYVGVWALSAGLKCYPMNKAALMGCQGIKSVFPKMQPSMWGDKEL